jgi:hypothetical protein
VEGAGAGTGSFSASLPFFWGGLASAFPPFSSPERLDSFFAGAAGFLTSARAPFEEAFESFPLPESVALFFRAGAATAALLFFFFLSDEEDSEPEDDDELSSRDAVDALPFTSFSDEEDSELEDDDELSSRDAVDALPFTSSFSDEEDSELEDEDELSPRDALPFADEDATGSF